MKNQQKNIAQFDLSPLAKAGIRILNMQDEIREEHDISQPHRDNHFLLMLAISGRFELCIDFQEIAFSNAVLFCVFPGQVHYIMKVQNPKGWIISFDPAVMDEDIKQLFESKFHSPISLVPGSDFYLSSLTMLGLIEKLQATTANTYSIRTIHFLLTAFLNLISSNLILISPARSANESRSTIIKDAFNQLLKQHYKSWKQPARYASELAISVAHLNDIVKTLTGNPVSVHIQQASILEAKRQLYFTNKSVKEIAYEMGYDEPVYFGKLFKKITDLTPVAFRKQFRD